MPDAAQNQLGTGNKAKQDNEHEFEGIEHQYEGIEHELEGIKQESVIHALNCLESRAAERAKREA
eukprot:3734659-Alexandrium_andersonii.AAC.1